MREVGIADTTAGLETTFVEISFYKNYLRLEKEKAHYESTIIDTRKKDKEFGKMLKNTET